MPEIFDSPGGERDTSICIKLDSYKRHVQTVMITLHMSVQKAILVDKDEKVNEVPRIKAIQVEMDEAMAMVAGTYHKIDNLVRKLRRAEAGEPEPEPEVKDKVEEEVEVKREIKMEED